MRLGCAPAPSGSRSSRSSARDAPSGTAASQPAFLGPPVLRTRCGFGQRGAEQYSHVSNAAVRCARLRHKARIRERQSLGLAVVVCACCPPRDASLGSASSPMGQMLRTVQCSTVFVVWDSTEQHSTSVSGCLSFFQIEALESDFPQVAQVAPAGIKFQGICS